LKRVFDKNPLMKHEDVQDFNAKKAKDESLIQRIKDSKLKRRQMKEKTKIEEEAEVSL
jgi:hypothetical protein